MENVPQPRAQHITESSNDYKEARQEIMDYIPEFARFFGEMEIETIDQARIQIDKIEDEISKESDKERQADLIAVKDLRLVLIKDRLDSLKGRLRAKLFSVDEFQGFLLFCEETKEIPDVQIMLSTLAKLYPDLDYRKNLAAAMGALLVNDVISDFIFEKMIRNHLSIYKKKQEEFHEQLGDVLADFRDRALEGIRSGYLPVDPNQLELRMGETRVYLADSLQVVNHLDGDYSPYTGIVRIVHNEDKEKQNKFIFHEMVHVISGQTLLKKNKKIPDDMPLMSDINIQRNGLGFYTTNIGDRRFVWLNEGVTEDIAVHLSQREDGAYQQERTMLANLIEAGIPRETIYEAYFENYNPDSKEKILAWKELTRKISELHPDMGGAVKLIELDDEYKKAQQIAKEADVGEIRAALADLRSAKGDGDDKVVP